MRLARHKPLPWFTLHRYPRKRTCLMCGKALNRGDALSRDCGGDCWECVLAVESQGPVEDWSPDARAWHGLPPFTDEQLRRWPELAEEAAA